MHLMCDTAITFTIIYCSVCGWKFFLTWWTYIPSVLWRCWLGGRKGIRPVKKTEWWGAGVVICLERGADLHMAQLMPLTLTVSCFSKIQIGFTFLVPAHPGSPGKRAVKWVCVCVVNIWQSYRKNGQLFNALFALLLSQSIVSNNRRKNTAATSYSWRKGTMLNYCYIYLLLLLLLIPPPFYSHYIKQPG